MSRVAPHRFEGLSVREAIVVAAALLVAADIEDGARDARRLACFALGVTAEDLIRDGGWRLAFDASARLAHAIERRLAREPVSRICGTRGFFGREFRLSSATLDPRPCSETLVEAVLELAREEDWRARPLHVLDVGVGSGCLLLSILSELSHATGVGTDLSGEALQMAAANAEALGLSSRARFDQRCYLEGIEESFDLLISNPPYIPTAEVALLEPEVRVFDPLLALDGGVDGLEAYRVLSHGMRRVVPDGWVVFEVGAGQACDVAALMLAALHSSDNSRSSRAAAPVVRRWTDLGGHERCVAIRTHSEP